MIKTNIKTVIPSLFMNVKLYSYKKARCKDKFIYLKKKVFTIGRSEKPFEFFVVL